MKIKVRMAIMSHLSDAQYLLSAGQEEAANNHINFAKILLVKFDDVNKELSSRELDEIWMNEMQGI